MDLAPWRARAYRWRRWLIALAVLLGLRAALPEVLRRVAASQASQALNAQVEIGDVDLRLWRGGIALEDVAVRARQPAAGAAPAQGDAAAAEDAPGDAAQTPAAATPAFGADAPLVAFTRFAVELRYWPLVHKTIQLRDIQLLGPRVALDRLADGDLNLMALVPSEPVAVDAGAPPTPAAAADAEAEPGWRVGLDRFVLEDGRIRFRDLMLEGSEPVEVGIDRVTVEEIALTPEVYGEPARIRLKLGVDEGIVDVDAQLKLVGGQAITTTTVTANRLPLRRARLYVPNVGWSDLRGELDLDLTYALDPGVTNTLRGTLGLREVSVNVPTLEDVAVGWKSLTVELDGIDLLAQHAAVRAVALDGASIQARAGGGYLLPALAQRVQASAPAPPLTPTAAPPDDSAAAASADVPPTVAPSDAAPDVASVPAETTSPSDAAPAPSETPLEAAAAASAAPTPFPAPEASPSPAPDAEPAPPWSWQVATLTITDTTVRVLSDAAPLDVGVTLNATMISSAADVLAGIELALALPQGSVQLDGDARLAPPAFGGRLRIADLALPPLVAVSGALPPEALPSGILRADLAIAAGLAPPARRAAAAPPLADKAPAGSEAAAGSAGVPHEAAAPPPAAETSPPVDKAPAGSEAAAGSAGVPPATRADDGAAAPPPAAETSPPVDDAPAGSEAAAGSAGVPPATRADDGAAAPPTAAETSPPVDDAPAGSEAAAGSAGVPPATRADDGAAAPPTAEPESAMDEATRRAGETPALPAAATAASRDGEDAAAPPQAEEAFPVAASAATRADDEAAAPPTAEPESAMDEATRRAGETPALPAAATAASRDGEDAAAPPQAEEAPPAPAGATQRDGDDNAAPPRARADGAGAAPDRLQVSGTLGLAALRAAPPQAGVALELQDLELTIGRLGVPGIIPIGAPAAADSAVDAALDLTLVAAQVTLSGGVQPLAVRLDTLRLSVPSLTVPATLARLAPGSGAPVVAAELTLELGGAHVVLGEDDTTVDAKRLALQVRGASVPVLVSRSASAAGARSAAPAPAVDAPAVDVPAVLDPAALATLAAAPPTRLALDLTLEDARVAMAQGKELVAGAQTIALALREVVVPGFVAGAPPQPAREPLQAGATLTLTQPTLARGDGKEFAVSAQSIAVPLTALSLPGGLAGQPTAEQPLRASFGEIRLEAPVVRVTRTKDGLVLPATGSAPPPDAAVAPAPVAAKPAATPVSAAVNAPAPAPTPATFDVRIAALRLLRGALEFTDRAVEPAFSGRYAPIEVDARDIHYPALHIKPLKVEINDANHHGRNTLAGELGPQGRITLAGELGPQGGALTVEIDQLNLLAFNPYARAYSPYSIADGSLTIETTATYRGGAYEVKNDVTLHQLDLAGVEGDSLFEQNFGVPLSLALALLRDAQGDIDLGIPLGVDREGKAAVDLMAVVRSALKQALVGAISSPLKLLGAATGGGSGVALAPAPIAFRLGRDAPTDAGAQSAERLAAFLASRPGMAVELGSSPTSADVRWLREQALASEWEVEGFFGRSLAFLTERGPRERIRTYLAARAADGTPPALSAEDQAILEQWLDERPSPAPDQLRALAEARLAAVRALLADQQIAAARVGAAAVAADPVDGSPVVTLKLGTALRASAP